MKGTRLKIARVIIAVAVLSIIAGCNGTAVQKKRFAVDFQKGRTVRYKFVSSRDIEINWGMAKTSSRRTESKVDNYRESMDMVVAYTPLEVDPMGLSTIKATCQSIKIRRTNGNQKDAAKSLAGKSFTFTVAPSGKIEDSSQLEQLIKEAGEKAFIKTDRSKGRTKEADMIGDFTATQWFLWDSISSIEKPGKGIPIGGSWKSQLSLPAPMVMRKARDVTYTLDEIRETEKGRLAVISSSYSPPESPARYWPMPYTGSFQMKGTFGFLRRFRILDLRGRGKELFNIDAGRIEQYNQQYKMKLQASLPLPLPGASPKITIDQKLTMQLLGKR
jgi:hypothetical protein